ncbi:MAG: glutathione peroxidase [SAR86 cluster bacterium]|uniref:Glutathione peroxidase n=1 Tax=SAR86 cluster bacterium TaxID=2030880 RepID=A0A368BKQ8_9GAMM|nr:MAG: glutathione peroxidase [Gammaproteobacteria bacterium TMED219]RCL37898.1 MAG: glutathione peroxidase [SAR86 cluster bacterium]|tara:strand:- start:27820 stop:28302 length:483 start_codon:yes stop_codon:yes gene_type:complete
MKESIYDYKVKDIDGKEVAMSNYKDKVLIIVNVASTCGFTPQYKGLQKLYDTFKDQGLVVLGFPCNQFGAQEQGGEAAIKDFCETNFSISFPMFAKIDVNGDNADPLFLFLQNAKKGFMDTEPIKWNFSKFVVDKEGNVVGRYGSLDDPAALEDDVKKLL